MSKKGQHFQTAVTLRMKGATLEEISDLTGVSKNSLSKWFQDEGVDSLREMLSAHPLQQVEKLDRMIATKIDEVFQDGGNISPETSDSLAKLLKVRKQLAGESGDDYMRYSVIITRDLANFATKYFQDDSDRRKLAGLLKSFYKSIKKEA